MVWPWPIHVFASKALLASGQREQQSLQRERDQLNIQVMERTADLLELIVQLARQMAPFVLAHVLKVSGKFR